MSLQLMTQADFARHRGAGKSSATNWKNAGLLVFAEGPNGKPMVDVARSDAKLNAKIDPMRGRPSTGGQLAEPSDPAPALPLESAPGQVAGSSPPKPTIADERQLHLREQRTGQALKNAQLAGDLVPLIEAERRVAEVGRAARERMHAWFRSIAERVAAEKDVRQIMAIAESGIDEVFAELAESADRGEFAGEDEELAAEELAEMEAAETE